MAFSVDLRIRVISAINDGMGITEAASIFKVCRKTVHNWQNLLKKTNSLAPKSGYQKGHSHKITDWNQFNPIEHHWTAVKGAIRKTAETTKDFYEAAVCALGKMCNA